MIFFTLCKQDLNKQHRSTAIYETDFSHFLLHMHVYKIGHDYSGTVLCTMLYILTYYFVNHTHRRKHKPKTTSPSLASSGILLVSLLFLDKTQTITNEEEEASKAKNRSMISKFQNGLLSHFIGLESNDAGSKLLKTPRTLNYCVLKSAEPNNSAGINRDIYLERYYEKLFGNFFGCYCMS